MLQKVAQFTPVVSVVRGKNVEKCKIGTGNEIASSNRLLCAFGKVINGNERPHSTGIWYGSDDTIQGILKVCGVL